MLLNTLQQASNRNAQVSMGRDRETLLEVSVKVELTQEEGIVSTYDGSSEGSGKIRSIVHFHYSLDRNFLYFCI